MASKVTGCLLFSDYLRQSILEVLCVVLAVWTAFPALPRPFVLDAGVFPGCADDGVHADPLSLKPSSA